MENEVLEETYSESPCSNLNAFSDQIFREKQESGGNRGIARSDLHVADQRRMLRSTSYAPNVRVSVKTATT